jgi:hypothetical protein
MGREGENLAPGAGEPSSAVDAYKASGTAVGGLHGEHDCRSGTKGQPPLVFPRAERLPGEECGASKTRCTQVCIRWCATWHTSAPSGLVRPRPCFPPWPASSDTDSCEGMNVAAAGQRETQETAHTKYQVLVSRVTVLVVRLVPAFIVLVLILIPLKGIEDVKRVPWFIVDLRNVSLARE